MPETTLEEIVEEVKALPPEQREKLREAVNLIIAEFAVGEMIRLMEKTLTLTPYELLALRDLLNTFTRDFAGPGGRAQTARSVLGKYAHLSTSSEAFAARKAEEISLEDRRSRP
jgi:hypothetical protein